jgi:hypothetical protein
MFRILWNLSQKFVGGFGVGFFTLCLIGSLKLCIIGTTSVGLFIIV